jgi:hypothetical protein
MKQHLHAIRRALVTIALYGATVAPLGLAGCGDGESHDAGKHEATFAGYVFDGSKDERLKNYAIEAWVDGKTIKGKVDAATGRYTLGPIRSWRDYTITITAEGYRAFRSHNAGFEIPSSFSNTDEGVRVDTKQSFLVDAYLFPTTLVAPETKLVVKLQDSQEKPSGKIRMRPMGVFVLGTDMDELGGVEGQVWLNDEDMQGRTVFREFQNGELVLAAGDLLYGVQYDVTIYDVAGYAPLEDDSGLGAGQDAYRAYTLEKQTTEPLAVTAFTAADACTPSIVTDNTAGSTITITLNSPIELVNSGEATDALRDASRAESNDGSNASGTEVDNPLQGVGITADGATITLHWNPDADLAVKDINDPIRCVQYRNLDDIALRKAGESSPVSTLRDLIFQASNGANRSLICAGASTGCSYDPLTP